jgi:hypothetical protein
MKTNLLEFLYGVSQQQSEIDLLAEDFAELLEKADEAEAESLATDKAPLSAALKSIGINGSGLQEDPEGFVLITDDREQYVQAVALLNDPEAMHTLAKKGWVAFKCGDQAMTNEEPEYKLRFLEIDTAETSDDESGQDDEEIMKKAREFATEEPDHDDENPVEHDAPEGNSLAKVKIGKATDGKKPEGSVKDSAQSVVADLLEDCGQPGSKLKQPKQGGKTPHAFKAAKKKK